MEHIFNLLNPMEKFRRIDRTKKGNCICASCSPQKKYTFFFSTPRRDIIGYLLRRIKYMCVKTGTFGTSSGFDVCAVHVISAQSLRQGGTITAVIMNAMYIHVQVMNFKVYTKHAEGIDFILVHGVMKLEKKNVSKRMNVRKSKGGKFCCK